jgi:hypothetical protein
MGIPPKNLYGQFRSSIELAEKVSKVIKGFIAFEHKTPNLA